MRFIKLIVLLSVVLIAFGCANAQPKQDQMEKSYIPIEIPKHEQDRTFRQIPLPKKEDIQEKKNFTPNDVLIKITSYGKGQNKHMAYTAAKVLSNAAILREYQKSSLQEKRKFSEINTDMDGEIKTGTQNQVNIVEELKGWVVPGINYTSINDCIFTKENDGKISTIIEAWILKSKIDNFVKTLRQGSN